MYILFREVRMSNFMSVGNNPLTIKLDKSPTTLISGKNGVGKSSICLDSIMFALYGKPYRDINKPNLVNSIIGKHMMVELDFEIGKKKYTVRRGLHPIVFEIYENGKLLRQDAKMKDYQQQFERNILRINERSCRQLIILGSANHVPFMQLPTHMRRGLIEDLLDIQIFSVMNSLAKERASSIKAELQSIEKDLLNLKSNYETLMTHQEKRKGQDTEFLKEQERKIQEIDTKITELKAQKEEAIEQKSAFVQGIDLSVEGKFRTKKKESEKMIIQIDHASNRLRQEINFFENNEICPTCHQGITEEFKTSRICKHQSKQQEYDGALKKLKDNIERLDHELSKLATVQFQLNALDQKVQAFDREIRLFEDRKSGLLDLNRRLEAQEQNNTKDLIKEVRNKIKTAARRKEALLAEREVAQTCVHLLKDDGIKSTIIKKYIPIINAQINKYLEEMEFFCDFSFDENFKEQIKARGRDEFGYNSFSQGEKARIDLAILLTFRDIAKMRNAVSTNLLILDEISDGSLDELGITGMLHILRRTSGTNIFVISHKLEMADKLFSHIELEKVKGFTQIKGMTV